MVIYFLLFASHFSVKSKEQTKHIAGNPVQKAQHQFNENSVIHLANETVEWH